MNAFSTWMSQQDPDQKMNIGMTLIIVSAIAFILILFLNTPNWGEVEERNRLSQRNHKRDRIECESKGGLLGQGGWTQDDGYSICHAVDSFIVLNGPRETL